MLVANTIQGMQQMKRTTITNLVTKVQQLTLVSLIVLICRFDEGNIMSTKSGEITEVWVHSGELAKIGSEFRAEIKVSTVMMGESLEVCHVEDVVEIQGREPEGERLTVIPRFSVRRSSEAAIAFEVYLKCIAINLRESAQILWRPRQAGKPTGRLDYAAATAIRSGESFGSGFTEILTQVTNSTGRTMSETFRMENRPESTFMEGVAERKSRGRQTTLPTCECETGSLDTFR